MKTQPLKTGTSDVVVLSMWKQPDKSFSAKAEARRQDADSFAVFSKSQDKGGIRMIVVSITGESAMRLSGEI